MLESRLFYFRSNKFTNKNRLAEFVSGSVLEAAASLLASLSLLVIEAVVG